VPATSDKITTPDNRMRHFLKVAHDQIALSSSPVTSFQFPRSLPVRVRSWDWWTWGAGKNIDWI